MAGKSDLVNGIVDRAAGTHAVPHPGGGDAQPERGGDDWGYASLLNTPPPDGSQRIGPSGGGN